MKKNKLNILFNISCILFIINIISIILPLPKQIELTKLFISILSLHYLLVNAILNKNINTNRQVMFITIFNLLISASLTSAMMLNITANVLETILTITISLILSSIIIITEQKSIRKEII